MASERVESATKVDLWQCQIEQQCVGLLYSETMKTCMLLQKVSGLGTGSDIDDSAIKDQLTVEEFEAWKTLVTKHEKMREDFKRC
jgi:hypothetical protein